MNGDMMSFSIRVAAMIAALAFTPAAGGAEETEETLLTVISKDDLPKTRPLIHRDEDFNPNEDAGFSVETDHEEIFYNSYDYEGNKIGGADEVLGRALWDFDGQGVTAYVLKPGFDPASVASLRERMITTIAEYAKPIPTHFPAENMRAYQALAILDPANATFAEKAARYAKKNDERLKELPQGLVPTTENGATDYSHPDVHHHLDLMGEWFYAFVKETDVALVPVFTVAVAFKEDVALDRLIVNNDGVLYRSGNMEFSSSPAGGFIYKVASYSIEDQDWLSLFREIAGATNSTIRIQGPEFHTEFVLTAVQKRVIGEMLDQAERMQAESGKLTSLKPAEG